MLDTQTLTGPFHVAKYTPPFPGSHGELIGEEVATFAHLEDAMLNAHELTDAPLQRARHACIYVEAGQKRELVWASG